MKDSWKDLEDIWASEDYNHRNIGTAFSGDVHLVRFLRKRWLWQGGVAVILFFGMMALFQMEGPVATVLQDNLRYVLAAQESDMTPVLETMARSGLWLDPFDNQVLQGDGKSAGVKGEEILAIPVSGKAARSFGHQRSPIDNSQLFHSGIDILAEPGAPIRATLDGTVIRVMQDPYLGRVVEMQHEGRITSLYGNLREVLVEVGQPIKQGEILGKAGGNSTSHANTVHFEVRENGEPIDPLPRMATVRTSI